MDYQPNEGGYYKRPLWQWIVLYVVIGGIVYGLVYYFFLARPGGGYEYGAPATTTSGTQWSDTSTTQPAPTPTPVQTPAASTQTPAPVTKPAPQQTQTQPTPAAKSFTVNGNDSSADLTTITVAKGTPVTITFGADANGTYHGGLDFRSSVVSTGPIAPGSTKTVHFTANQSFAFTPYWPSTDIAKPYQISIVVQ